MTDIELIRSEIATRLPVRARWLVSETPLDFDFSRSQAPLELVKPCDFNSAITIQEEWTRLRVFGEQDYGEGGGANAFLGVHSGSGEVFGLDAEREMSQMFLLNSDVDRFIRPFLALDRLLGARGPRDAHIGKRLSEIDPGAFERSEWRLLLDHVTQ